ncbi:MAG: hypothetical protein AAF483_18690, partial [Planctomycetota bacterium]
VSKKTSLILSHGLRIWCRVEEDQTIATFVFHHACCDGIGAYQFIGDVLWFYGTAMGDELEPLIELNEADLRARLRESSGPALLGFQKHAKMQPPFGAPVCPVASNGGSGQAERVYPNFFTATYEKNEYRDLRLKAQDRGQTINEMLLENLFVALAKWNQKYGFENPEGDIAVNMPLDLREPGQSTFSATNMVTTTLLRRTVSEIEDRDRLEQTLREELAKLKHGRFESPLIRYLITISKTIEEMAVEIGGDRCLATVTFSNTGDPTKRFLTQLPKVKGRVKAGNLVLEDINGVSPLRINTRMAISLFSYQRRLRLCMRTDSAYLSDQASQEFLDSWVECIDSGLAK